MIPERQIEESVVLADARRRAVSSLSPVLTHRLAGYALAQVTLGESGATVWRCAAANTGTLYLKTAPLAAALDLDGERARLVWLKERGQPVPAVRDYGRDDVVEWLLVDEVDGVVASDPSWTAHAHDVAIALGSGLARLHRSGVRNCPFDQRVAAQVDAARRRTQAGLVREDEFDESRLGHSPVELLDEVARMQPGAEDLVLSHGDFCLPNILLRRSSDHIIEMAGVIDCARAGVADRHQDLALAIRSIRYNFGERWVASFLEAYGMPEPDAAKLEFFMLLDEFF